MAQKELKIIVDDEITTALVIADLRRARACQKDHMECQRDNDTVNAFTLVLSHYGFEDE